MVRVGLGDGVGAVRRVLFIDFIVNLKGFGERKGLFWCEYWWADCGCWLWIYEGYGWGLEIMGRTSSSVRVRWIHGKGCAFDIFAQGFWV